MHHLNVMKVSTNTSTAQLQDEQLKVQNSI